MGGATASGTARPVAVLPLSPSQKLVTVELGRGEDKLWLVLGVTPSSITTLHTMAALPPLPPQAPGSGADAPDGGSTADSFAQLLERLRGGDPGNKHGR
jgi:flagellar protein FliO/FliZ